MWRGDKETDEETIGLICSLTPPSFQGSVGLARSALSVRDHNGIGLWMCGMGVLLLETGARALSCSPRFQHVGRQRIYVAPWHIKSLPSCRQVIQNTPRMKHPIIRKGVESEWETERLVSRDLWQQYKEWQCWDRKRDRALWLHRGGRRSDHRPGLGLFSMCTIQRLAETCNWANRGFIVMHTVSLHEAVPDPPATPLSERKTITSH